MILSYERRQLHCAPACPAQRHREDDFIICGDGHDVGRLYKGTFAGGVGWFWTIFIIDGLRRIEGVPIRGLAESFEDAKRQFGSSYEKIAASATNT
jgi:hypothetical protein